MSCGQIHDTKHNGKLEIIKYKNCHDVAVRFLDTGHITSKSSSLIRSGLAKDNLRPSVCGVGFIGVGQYKAWVNGKQTTAYQTWNNMIKRCYSVTGKDYKYYMGKGVTVCEEWHNFQNFAEWYYDNYPNDGNKYEVDKDILKDGNNSYCPQFCMFVIHQKNSEKAHSRVWKFTSPKCEIVEIYNLNKFCAENGLSQGKMSLVASGKRKSHKGWKKGA